MYIRGALSVIFVVVGSVVAPAQDISPDALRFESGTFDGWRVEGDGTWSIGKNPELLSNPGDPVRFVVDSLFKGEANTGVLRSKPFTIEKEVQRFSISGWDGTANGVNDGDKNHVLLRSYPDGAILRRAHTPGGNKLTAVKWPTMDLIGRKVFIEVVDANPMIRQGGYAWIWIVFFSGVCTKVLIWIFEGLQFYNWTMMATSPCFVEFCTIFFAVIAFLIALLIGKQKRRRKNYSRY